MAKVVVRLLPPSLTADDFNDFVGSSLLKKCDWVSFSPSISKEANSRGYLHFAKNEDVDLAIAELNGKAIGGFRASVTLASNQRFEKDVVASAGSIEEDSIYKDFVSKLQNRPALPIPPPQPEMNAKTPLILEIERLRGQKQSAPQKPKQNHKAKSDKAKKDEPSMTLKNNSDCKPSIPLQQKILRRP